MNIYRVSDSGDQIRKQRNRARNLRPNYETAQGDTAYDHTLHSKRTFFSYKKLLLILPLIEVSFGGEDSIPFAQLHCARIVGFRSLPRKEDGTAKFEASHFPMRSFRSAFTTLGPCQTDAGR